MPNFMAVSSPKCNGLMRVLLGVERLGHEHLGRAVPAGRFARLGVELPSEDVQFVLREGRQINALREILPKQAIAVLVDVALPRAVGIGEIGAYPDFRVRFPTLIATLSGWKWHYNRYIRLLPQSKSKHPVSRKTHDPDEMERPFPDRDGSG